MVELAHFKRFAFMSPFWAGYLRGYVDFNDATKYMPWPMLRQLAQTTWSENLVTGVYSVAGIAYRNALLVPADVTPPVAPEDVVSRLLSPNSAVLTWSPASDDTGTSAYWVFRDSMIVGQTAMKYFLDEGLPEARPFVYSVVAFDASGNVSASTSTVLKTPDITAPSVPQNFTAVATRIGAQINVELSWAPSSDNVGVTQYRLSRGLSPDNLSVIAGPTANSYTLVNVKPDTTFYFSVSSIDGSWNVSDGAVVTVTTPSLPDVTPPFVSVAYPGDSAIVHRRLSLYALSYDVQGGLYDMPSGPVAVRFLIDGLPVGEEQTVPYTQMPTYSVFKLDTPWLSLGNHQVTAVGRDLAGNMGFSAPILIAVRP
jgi:hypothetical protein